MRTHPRLGLALFLIAPTWCSSQILPLGTFSGALGFINTLSSGPKFYTSSSLNTFDLLEPDLTPYASVVLPPPPAGYQYNSSAYYITETLFDTDAQNFEFAFGIRSNANVYGTMIIRQDGTILLTDPSHVLGGQSGIDAFWTRSPIVNTAAGTYMALQSGSGLSNESTLYLLPGALPCVDCNGPILMTNAQASMQTGTLQVFPDPASDAITLVLADAQGTGTGVLQVVASDGRIVLQQPWTGPRAEVAVRSWANGTYSARVMTVSGQLMQCSFVVQR